MRLKFTSDHLINGLAILFFCFSLSVILSSEMSGSTETIIVGGSPDDKTDEIYGNLKPVDPELSQELPHSQYLKLKDSIKNSRELKDGVFRSVGASVGIGFIATSSGLFYNNGYIDRGYIGGSGVKGENRFYIKLPGWTLKEDDYREFFVRNDTAFVRKAVWHSQRVSKKNGSFRKGNYEDVPVPFRYDSEEKSVLIPVDQNTTKILYFILCFIALIFVASYLYFIIAGIIKLLIDISRGNVFTDNNIRRLRIVTIVNLLFPVLILFLHFLMKLVFWKHFTNDLVMSKSVYESQWENIVMGIIALLIFKAFKQGKKIQEQQDLTI